MTPPNFKGAEKCNPIVDLGGELEIFEGQPNHCHNQVLIKLYKYEMLITMPGLNNILVGCAFISVTLCLHTEIILKFPSSTLKIH